MRGSRVPCRTVGACLSVVQPLLHSRLHLHALVHRQPGTLQLLLRVVLSWDARQRRQGSAAQQHGHHAIVAVVHHHHCAACRAERARAHALELAVAVRRPPCPHRCRRRRRCRSAPCGTPCSPCTPATCSPCACARRAARGTAPPWTGALLSSRPHHRRPPPPPCCLPSWAGSRAASSPATTGVRYSPLTAPRPRKVRGTPFEMTGSGERGAPARNTQQLGAQRQMP